MNEKINILIIDDEKIVRRSLAAFLGRYGFQTIEAENGRMGLTLFRRERPDLILVDLRMPEVDGLDVIAAVHQESPDLPIIVVSGAERISDAVEALRLGAWDYLIKPVVDMSVLIHAVEKALERARLIQENKAYQEHLKEEVARRTADLEQATNELQKAHDELEQRVIERTAELLSANEKLQHEIKERKKLEKVLMHREKLNTLGAIAAEVAHEIRNPLVSIGGFAHRLIMKYPDLKECDIILSESRRLEKILTRIMNYLKPVELHPRECLVNTIIRDCTDLLSPETEGRQIKCRLDLQRNLPAVYVDPEVLAQVVIDLIRSSTESLEKGGELTIKSFESDGGLNIEFKNHGPGSRVKNTESLFMPFSEGGNHFGLPLCYRLLKDMGGVLSFSQDKEYMAFMISIPNMV